MVHPSPARISVDQALVWIGFGIEGKCNSICDGLKLEEFDNLVGLIESNILDIASGFSKKTTVQEHMNFGMQLVKYTLEIVQWNQDESRCSYTASYRGIANTEEYKALLLTTLYRNTLRKVGAYQSESINKAADPGKFKYECIWPE